MLSWAKAGVWRRVFEELAATGGPPAKLMLDSTSAKAHRSATGGSRPNKINPLGGTDEEDSQIT